MTISSWLLRLYHPRHRFGGGFRGPLRLRIRGPGRVRFGRDVRVSNEVGRSVFLTFTPQARIDVGDRVRITGASLQAATGIVIEEDAILGACLLLDTDFHSIGPGRREPGAEASRRPIRIGRNAWVQDQAAVLKGVTVGEGAIIGYGAVVASDVAPNSLVRGNPASEVERLPTD